MQTVAILFCYSKTEEEEVHTLPMHTSKMWCWHPCGPWALWRFSDERHCSGNVSKCNAAEKQMQHSNPTPRSHVDYCMWSLTNHPFYFKCWVVLLISFFFLLTPTSSSSSLPPILSALPLAGFIRQFPLGKVRAPLPGLCWRPWEGLREWLTPGAFICGVRSL